jgi:N6-L-threonylcarbamoyladenine synthase
MMRVLGIESSCDETAAAVVDGEGVVLGSIVASQVEAHARFGGVVPDLAARMHIEAIGQVVEGAMRAAKCEVDDLSAVAVTRHPGLIGSLLIGVGFAESLAYAAGLPLFGVDHIEGHIWSGFMTQKNLEAPVLALVVSGGHTALYRYDGLGRARLLSRTVDDAAGEAFDKVSSLLELGYPGGPAIERAAVGGDPRRYNFPRGRVKSKPLAFSFSGLKTAVLYELKGQNARPGDAFKGDFELADVAASFQHAVVEALVDRSRRALEQEGLERLVVCGGVAANCALRARLEEVLGRRGVQVIVPPLSLCTDNGVMIAGLGAAYLAAGRAPDGLGLEARARSSLSR